MGLGEQARAQGRIRGGFWPSAPPSSHQSSQCHLGVSPRCNLGAPDVDQLVDFSCCEDADGHGGAVLLSCVVPTQVSLSLSFLKWELRTPVAFTRACCLIKSCVAHRVDPVPHWPERQWEGSTVSMPPSCPQPGRGWTLLPRSDLLRLVRDPQGGEQQVWGADRPWRMDRGWGGGEGGPGVRSTQRGGRGPPRSSSGRWGGRTLTSLCLCCRPSPPPPAPGTVWFGCGDISVNYSRACQGDHGQPVVQSGVREPVVEHTD